MTSNVIQDDESAAAAIARTPPGKETATLCLALALGATGRFDELERVLRAGIAAGVSRATLAEALLMVHLFGGFPRAIEAFRALERVAPHDAAAPPPAPSPVESLRRRAGNDLFGKIYGDQARAVLEQLARAHPTLAEAVLVDAYGRVLAREGIEPRVRELMAITALATVSLPRQLESHVRGALRAGASIGQLRGAAALAGAIAGSAALDVATAAIERAADRCA